MQHTKTPFRLGENYGSIVSDDPTEGNRVRGFDDVSAYGGYLVAESVGDADREFICQACNADDAVVAALDQLLTEADLEPRFDGKACDCVMPEQDCIYCEARTALALAREEAVSE